MARPRRYLNLLNGWEQVEAALTANATDLPHLEALRVKLQGMLQQARDLTAQQSTLTASKQDVTRKLQKAIRDGEALVDLLRTGAREHYGPTSEKLVEFGMQPFRGRARKAVSKPSEPGSPQAPDAPSSSPTPDAAK